MKLQFAIETQDASLRAMNMIAVSACFMVFAFGSSQVASAQDKGLPEGRSLVIGVMAGGGTAIADRISGAVSRAPATLNFTSAGIRFGGVMNRPHGRGVLRNQFEIGSEFTPFWQAVYPKQTLVFPVDGCQEIDPDFGYTTRGVSLTPLQLRLDFVKNSSFVPWAQIACGVLWTTRDFPTLKTASVNFMPQAGFGAHYFIRKHQSIDVAANAVHISNGDTADRNPGVNVTFQASIGYSWWFQKR